MSTIKATLEQNAPFNEFEKTILDQFISAAREQTFSAGETLFHELTEGDEIFFITDGTFRVSVELASAYHMVEEIKGGAGNLVGEGRFIADGPRPATVTAKTDITALVWDVSSWKEIADRRPDVGYRLAIFAGQILFARVQELRAHLIDDMAWGLE